MPDRDKPAVRRLNQKPDKKKGGGRKEDGPKRGDPYKREGKKSTSMDDELNARARAMRVRPGGRKKKSKAKSPAPPSTPTGPPRVTLGETITVGELASALDVGAAEIVKDLMKMGVLASITQSIDADTAEKIAQGYGAIVTRDAASDSELETGALGVIEEEEEASTLMRRPPVVTIMGHVDHGKTSLLDALRASSVAEGEAGGITQHIGAYSVPFPESVVDGDADDNERLVTFIDTPGHAAFSEMRSRGANVTDIVILVVAADDGVKEQTVQSIKAARAGGVPILVALTKVDKPDADVQKVKLQLLEQEVVLEDFGGEELSVGVSAKTGDGLDDLMEQISLLAQVLDLRANPNRLASGVVIEAKQQTGQGAVATVLVQRGTLKIGDIVVAGSQWGRVRSLVDHTNERLQTATPSVAVELVGLSGMPEAGDQMTVTSDEQAARNLAETRQRLKREKRSSMLFQSRSSATQELFLGGLKEGELPTKLLDFVVKADVQGSAEALTSALSALTAADDKLQVKTRVLRSGAGAITNEDIMLASVSSATIIGFNTIAPAQQKEEAQKVGVDIKEFSIVYDALDDVTAMMASLIRPPPNKQLGALVGILDVQQIFKIGAIGKVAGCRVLDGYIKVGCNIRILRGNLVVYEGKLQSLRSGKDMAEQINAPDECGLSFEDFQLMEPGDRAEAYAARETDDDDDDE